MRVKRRDRKARLALALVCAASSCAFQQEREAETTADAERRESESCLSLLHFVDQRRRDPHAGAANRMAQRDRAAVDIQAFRIEVQFTITRDHLGGESFVQFDQIDFGKT